MSGGHSSGLWLAAKQNASSLLVVPFQPHGFRCQIVTADSMVAHAFGRTEAQCEANAHLIAAAPMLLEGAADTLEALKLLRVGLAHDAEAIKLIDAHIEELEYATSKARGQS